LLGRLGPGKRILVGKSPQREWRVQSNGHVCVCPPCSAHPAWRTRESIHPAHPPAAASIKDETCPPATTTISPSPPRLSPPPTHPSIPRFPAQSTARSPRLEFQSTIWRLNLNSSSNHPAAGQPGARASASLGSSIRPGGGAVGGI